MAIITISRGTMSGGKKLAEMLAEKLGYRCVSREIIIKAADDYGVAESKLFEAIQKSPSIFQKLTFERECYLAFIQASLCEYAKDDNLIYHGNAGHFLLKGLSHVLRIRLLAHRSYRIQAASAQFGFTEKEALKYIERVDRERARWTKFLYGSDWVSPDLYDMVYNLEHIDLDFVCNMILYAVKQPQFQTTAQSAQAMNDLLMVSRIRAALARIPNIRLEHLEVNAAGPAVSIRGRVKSKKLLDAVLETVEKVPGVKSVENLVQVDYRSFGIE